MSSGIRPMSQVSTTGTAAAARMRRVAGVCCTPVRISPSARRPMKAWTSASPVANRSRAREQKLVALGTQCVRHALDGIVEHRAGDGGDNGADDAAPVRSERAGHQIGHVDESCDRSQHRAPRPLSHAMRFAQGARHGNRADPRRLRYVLDPRPSCPQHSPPMMTAGRPLDTLMLALTYFFAPSASMFGRLRFREEGWTGRLLKAKRGNKSRAGTGGKRAMTEFDGPRTRRDFLRKTTALAGLGITTSLTPDLVFAQAKTDLKGVTIDYWNMIGVQNKLVRQLSEFDRKGLRAEDRGQGKPHLEQLRRHHRPEIPYEFPGRREADRVRCFRPLDRAAPPLPVGR